MKKSSIKKMAALIITLGLVLGLTACGQTDNETTAAAAAATVETTAEAAAAGTEATTGAAETSNAADTYIFTDSAGREVEVSANIERLAPSGTLAQIVIFALAPDRFVGLANDWSEYSDDFLDSKYLELPTFGQLYGSEDLNLEALAAADPQIIIDVGEAKETIVEDMDSLQEKLGIPVVHINATTETMSETYEILGQLLGLESEAKVLSDYCDEIYSMAVDTMEEIGEANKVDLLYCLGDSGTNVIAKGSYHAEVIDLLTNNLAVVDDPSSKGSGNEASMEQIYNWDPDYIVFAPSSIYSTVGENETWESLTAISSGNYYEVPIGPYNWMGFPPSVNRYMGMLWLGQILYPDYFEYDLYEEAVRYYDLFFHCDLTQEQFDNLTANSIGK